MFTSSPAPSGFVRNGTAITNVPATGTVAITPVSNNTTTLKVNQTGGTTDVLTVDTTDSQLNLRGINDEGVIGATNLFTSTAMNNATYWTLGTGWTASASVATATAATGNLSSTSANFAPTVGVTYYVTLVCTISVGSLALSFGGVTLPTVTFSGSYKYGVTATTTDPFVVNVVSTLTGTISGIISKVKINSLTAANSILNFKNSANAISFEARAFNPADSSLALGYNAMTYGNASTQLNTAYGTNALSFDVVGTGNTAYGANALQNVTTGSTNTALGSYALQNMNSGVLNLAVGGSALRANAYGSDNVAIGGNALTASTGSNNLALGFDAGVNVTTGASNFILGTNAAPTLTTGSNNLVIGTSIDVPTASTSNYMSLGGVITGNTNTQAVTFVGAATAAGITASTYALNVTPSGGTQQYTAIFQDQTASTGQTQVLIKGGAGEANTNILEFRNSAGSELGFMRSDGLLAALFVASQDNATWALPQITTGGDLKGLALTGTGGAFVSWSNGGAWYNTKDVALTRNAAGVLEIDDGNTAGVYRDLILRHITVEGVTSTGATGSGSVVFSASPTITSPTITGATMNATTLATDTTTGLTIGTATSQKLGFFNATPVVQQLATTDLGTTLSNLGLRAAGTAYPITTSGALNLSGTWTNNTVPANALATTAITLGYAQITASITTSSATFVQATGLTATVTIPAGGRSVKVTVYTTLLSSAVSGCELSIWSGVVGSGTQLQQLNSNGNTFAHMTFVHTPSPGSLTYNVGYLTANALDAVTLYAASTYPAFLLVEAI